MSHAVGLTFPLVEIAIWKHHSRLTMTVLTVIRHLIGMLAQLSEHAQNVVLLVIYKVTTGAVTTVASSGNLQLVA